MSTLAVVLLICLILAVLLDIFLLVRVLVLRNNLFLFSERLKEIEIRLLPGGFLFRLLIFQKIRVHMSL